MVASIEVKYLCTFNKKISLAQCSDVRTIQKRPRYGTLVLWHPSVFAAVVRLGTFVENMSITETSRELHFYLAAVTAFASMAYGRSASRIGVFCDLVALSVRFCFQLQ